MAPEQSAYVDFPHIVRLKANHARLKAIYRRHGAEAAACQDRLAKLRRRGYRKTDERVKAEVARWQEAVDRCKLSKEAMDGVGQTLNRQSQGQANLRELAAQAAEEGGT